MRRPKSKTKVCSVHFVGGHWRRTRGQPSYIPSIKLGQDEKEEVRMEPLGIGEIFQVDTLISISVPHILERIFFSLDYVSYLKCAVVSTKWNKLLSSERFQRLKKDVFREDIEKELMHALRRRNTNPHPFHKYGCYAPDTNKIRKLVSNDLVDVNFMHGDLEVFEQPLLIAAVQRGDTGLVQYLIEKGADITRYANNEDGEGEPALYLAAQDGHVDIVRMLLDAGAEPDSCGDHGVTPLHTAAMQRHIEVVQLLLNRGADVNRAKKVGGYTPLHGAAIGGHKDIVKLLLKHGADHRMTNHYGWTPLMIAEHQGHWDFVNENAVDILRQYEAV